MNLKCFFYHSDEVTVVEAINTENGVGYIKTRRCKNCKRVEVSSVLSFETREEIKLKYPGVFIVAVKA